MPRQSDVSSLLLGVPAFALAFAITTVSVLVPLTLERRAASPLLIGMVVAGEGLIALSLPLWIGPLSDRTQSTWGGRLPYVMLGCALCAPALAALPFVHSIAGIAALMLAFYAGYFTYYPAYRALYPELVPEARFARSQGVQSLLREVGLVLALTASPVLFSMGAPLPFFVCALVLLPVSGWFVLRLRSRVPRQHRAHAGGGVGVDGDRRGGGGGGSPARRLARRSLRAAASDARGVARELSARAEADGGKLRAPPGILRLVAGSRGILEPWRFGVG